MKHIEWYSGKRILVTGGAGFIGSHLVEALVQAQAKVSILDDFSTGSLDNIRAIKNNISIIAGSIEDKETCLKVCKNIDVIFHLAAVSSVVQAEEYPDDCYSVNIQGTYNILNAARAQHVSRIIFASSAAVYGAQEGLLSETLSCNPISIYGHSKYMAEQWCKWFTFHHQLNITCLRYFNVFGERQRGDLPHSAIVAKLHHHMRNNLPITIFGDGNQTRDFISVERVVEANLRTGMQQALAGKCINVATGKSQSINEIMEEIKQRYENFSAPITYNPARENDIVHSVGNINILQKLSEIA